MLKPDTGVLSPVPESRVQEARVTSDNNESRDNETIAATPAMKKKRKLYKQTPQLSEVG